MTNRQINIPQDYTRYPAGRYISDGSFSGQRFRDELLVPALHQADKVEVHLDGTLGYGSSFLEEAFGGLVRIAGFEQQDLMRRLVLISQDETLIAEIRQYLGISIH
jgi:STAS-like domain of unknown function (DUF4325)